MIPVKELLASMDKRRAVTLGVLALCAVMPFLAPAVGEPYFVKVFARIMLWGMAAASLNLILGYGGMISFGHAVYVGIGAYTVGILAYYEVTSGFIQWPLAVALSALAALIFGVFCLRTRGVYFIMITLAFAQMVYYLSVSAEEFGSDDGMTIESRSDFGADWFDLNNPLTMYYTIFAVLLATLWFLDRIIKSRFGMVIRGAKSNEMRLRAIGFPTFHYKLMAFVIAGVICGISGALTANIEDFVSPDLLHWTRSGELIFMVVLGGMGTLFGPVTGALVYLLLSEVLSNITVNWHLIFGPFLILVVLYLNRGIDSLFDLNFRGGRGP